MNFLHAKMRLRANITLFFRNLILVRYRSGSGFRAPGLDLLASLPDGEQAWLHLQHGYLLSPFCFPANIVQDAMVALKRPPMLDGVNILTIPAPLPAPPPHCTNDTAAPVLERCYPLAGLYVDAGIYGLEVNNLTQKTELSGYLIHFLDITFLCPWILSVECISKLGPVGCVYYTLNASSTPASTPAPPPAPPPSLSSLLPSQSAAEHGTGSASAAVEGDHGAPRRLAIILGSVLGGTAFVVAALLATLLFARQRARQRRALEKRENDEAAGGAELPPGWLTAAGESGVGRKLSVCKASDAELGRLRAASEAELSGGGLGGKAAAAPTTSPMHGAYGIYDRSNTDDISEPTYISQTLHALAAGTVAAAGGPGLCPLTEDDASESLAFTAIGCHSFTTSPATIGGHAALLSTAGAVITTATPPRADFRFGVRVVTASGRGGAAATTTAVPQSNDSAAPLSPAAAGRVGAAFVRSCDDTLYGKAAGAVGAEGSAAQAVPGVEDGIGDGGGGGGGGAGAGAHSNVVSLTRRVLGKGATGRVYEGVYMGQAVAVKVVYSEVIHAPAPPAAAVQPAALEPSPLPSQDPHTTQSSGGAQSGATQRRARAFLGRDGGDPDLEQHREQQQEQQQPQGQQEQQQGQGRSDAPAVAAAMLGLGGFPRRSAGAASATLSVTVESVRELQTGSTVAGSSGLAAAAAPAASQQSLQSAAAAVATSGSTGVGVGVSSSSGSVGGRLLHNVSPLCSAASASHHHQQAPPGGAGDDAAPPPPQQQQQQQQQPRQHGSSVQGVSPSFLDAHDPRFEALFCQEAEVLGRCCHPNVVRLLAACVTPPRLCLVMELMETSLESLIYAGRTALIPLSTVLHIAAEVCRGLEYLHPTIIHRDLKPANVLLNSADSPTPVVKLSDFGLARIRSATMPTQHPGAGTPAYLAPECYDLENNVVTHHADMFALGVLLWAMLTGQHPWKDHTVVAVGYKVSVLKERLPLDQLSSRRCPPKLKKLVRRCWEEDPRRRPAAAEAAKELQVMRQQVLCNGGHHQRYTSGLSGPTARLRTPRSQSRPFSDAAGVDGPQRVLSVCAPAPAAAAARDGRDLPSPSAAAAAVIATAAAGSGAPEVAIVLSGSPGDAMGLGAAVNVSPFLTAAAADAATVSTVSAASAAGWQTAQIRQADCQNLDSVSDTDSGSLSEGTLNRIMGGVTLELSAE